MSEAKRLLVGDETLLGFFKEALFPKAVVDDKVVSRTHTEIVIKTINARAGSIFETFQDLFVGHYSKKVNVELRKTLQVQSKSKHQKTVVKIEKDEDEDEVDTEEE